MMLLLFFPVMLQASHSTDEVLDLLRQAEEKKSLYLEEAKSLEAKAKQQLESSLKSHKINQETKVCHQEMTDTKKTHFDRSNNSILIFVSLSMPEHALQSLYHEAEQMGATLILRGLKNNSFKQTAETLKSLKISVQIDPELFKKYHIENVPAFVLVGQDDFHILNGNVTLEYAKKKLLEAHL